MKRGTKRKPNPDQLPLITPDTDWQRPAELPDVRGQLVAIDLETRDDGLTADRGAGWAFGLGYICGVAAAWEGGSGYFPIRHPDTECFEEESVYQWIRDLCKSGTRFVTQNGGYDWGWLRWNGVPVPYSRFLEDTQAAAVIVDENRVSYALNNLLEWQGFPTKDEQLLREAAEAFGTDPKKGLWRLPARFVGPYATRDCTALLDLLPGFKAIHAKEGTEEAYRLEVDLIPCVLEMRRRGIRLDTAAAERAAAMLYERRDAMLAELRSHLGSGPIITMEQINSPKWLEAKFDQEKLSYPRTEKTEQGSFTKDWMAKSPHWMPTLIHKASKYHEAAHKFLEGFLLEFANQDRLHAEIHSFRNDDGGTRSHRFSYSNPPLQQMPARDGELAELIRGCFLPEEGEWWASPDYSQQEYRLIVHYAAMMDLPKADDAVQKYKDDPRTDYHSMVAEMTGLDRKPAKDTNFAKAFGAGIAKFAAMIGKSREEAAAIYEQYDRELPFVSKLSDRCKSAADSRGFIKLIDGARCHFDLWEPSWREPGEKWEGPRPKAMAEQKWQGRRLKRSFTHKAMNRLIQGSAARQTKAAMRACWNEGMVPLLQMHDELPFSFGNEQSGLRVVELMKEVIPLEVPVVVDLEWGKNWGKAKHTWEERDD
jgi:DNA polymerase I-like protein with 3'-5' exonuclease and polymerase domains